jgi:hypothetical protein
VIAIRADVYSRQVAEVRTPIRGASSPRPALRIGLRVVVTRTGGARPGMTSVYLITRSRSHTANRHDRLLCLLTDRFVRQATSAFYFLPGSGCAKYAKDSDNLLNF